MGDPEVFSMEPPSKTNGWNLKIEKWTSTENPKKVAEVSGNPLCSEKNLGW